MKKKVVLSSILIFLIFLGMIFIINFFNTSVALTKEESLIGYVETTTVKSNYEIAQSIGDVDSAFIDLANAEINKLPDNLIAVFVESGWHIYVTDENLSEKYFNNLYSSVEGATIYEDKIIVIENRKKAIKESIIHEFGHFFDYYLGLTSETDEFKEIYEEEVDEFKSKIKNSSCVRDEREFLAEEFYYYFKDSSKCTKNAYNYIKNMINNL